MCGIGAILAHADDPALAAIGDLMASVRHRGPDDEGYAFIARDERPTLACGGVDTPAACYGTHAPHAPRAPHAGTAPAGSVVALGHRRLSIVDLSPAGHQPMSYGDGRFWIVYNGEVYNHLELRAELEALGHQFASHCDTEVVLAAYAQWGEDCLHRFNGMFAFVLVDRAERRLFAARDRFGVKPLYYWISPTGAVAFASEIKQFACMPGWQARIDGQRAYDFLNWSLLDHTERTLFAGVHQLRNGECVGIDFAANPRDRGRLACRRWYELRPATFRGSYADATAAFRDLFFDAVRLRLRADVLVGSCLSGGLDSSSIVCVMGALLREHGAADRQRTFSACSPEARFDERTYIEAVADALALDARYVYPEPGQAFDELDELTWHQDEPFGSTSIYAQWCVFRLAAQAGVKVMLDGQGADEQLAGYHPYFGLRLAALARRGRLRELAAEVSALRRMHGYGAGWSLKQTLNYCLPEWLRQPLRLLAGKPAALAPAWLDVMRLGAEPADPFLGADGTQPGDVYALSHAQLTRTNVQMLLHWEDRDSMAHSIESRVPFLDYRLVEFVLGLPEEYKLAGGTTKRVLRASMQDLLPEKVRTRTDKLGFVTAEEVWLRRDVPSRFEEAIDAAITHSHGVLRGRLRESFDRVRRAERAFDHSIWRAISFGAWMRRFGVTP